MSAGGLVVVYEVPLQQACPLGIGIAGPIPLSQVDLAALGQVVKGCTRGRRAVPFDRRPGLLNLGGRRGKHEQLRRIAGRPGLLLAGVFHRLHFDDGRPRRRSGLCREHPLQCPARRPYKFLIEPPNPEAAAPGGRRAVRRQIVLLRYVQKSGAVRKAFLQTPHLLYAVRPRQRLLHKIGHRRARFERHRGDTAAGSHGIANRGRQAWNLARDMVLADQHKTRVSDGLFEDCRALAGHLAVRDSQAGCGRRQAAFQRGLPAEERSCQQNPGRNRQGVFHRRPPGW